MFLTILLPLLMMLFGGCRMKTVAAFGARLSPPWERQQRARLRRLSLLRAPTEDDDVLLLVLAASSASASEQLEDNDNLPDVSLNNDASTIESIQEHYNHEEIDHLYPIDNPLAQPVPKNKNNNSPHGNTASVWKNRKELFALTRPSSIPGTILFHMLGVFLVLRGTVTTGVTATNYWSLLLKEPTLWLTLLATNLVSASSMVVNDYYDAKLGRDALKHKNKALVDESVVSKATAKRFLMNLYAVALVVSTCLPGAPTRLSVVTALIMTYLYTKHLKPVTWVKNAVCASLIALAPWTSGSCAWNLLQSSHTTAAAATTTTTVLQSVWLEPELCRVFAVLFAGVMGREILMDCNDVEADEAAGIRTVPVVHGRRFAVTVAAASTVVMTVIATVPPLLELIRLWSTSTSAAAAAPLWSSAPLRRLLLAGLSSGAYLRNNWRIWKTKGEDETLITKSVDFCLLAVFGLLLSFV